MIVGPWRSWIWFVLLWGAVAGCFIFLAGCVSIRTHERAKKDAACAAMRKCRSIAYHDHALNTVDAINKRIKKEQCQEF